jgi:hypothetical protein
MALDSSDPGFASGAGATFALTLTQRRGGAVVSTATLNKSATLGVGGGCPGECIHYCRGACSLLIAPGGGLATGTCSSRPVFQPCKWDTDGTPIPPCVYCQTGFNDTFLVPALMGDTFSAVGTPGNFIDANPADNSLSVTF